MSFPRSLALIGLSPGFTHEQFKTCLGMERSDAVRRLAHEEWLDQQAPEYENVSNYRWHLSYVSMKSEYTRDCSSVPSDSEGVQP